MKSSSGHICRKTSLKTGRYRPIPHRVVHPPPRSRLTGYYALRGNATPPLAECLLDHLGLWTDRGALLGPQRLRWINLRNAQRRYKACGHSNDGQQQWDGS